MNAKELLILNFEEVRRRSIRIWKGIAEDQLYWRPDPGAMTCFEMIRHILETENIYHQVILNKGVLGDYQSPLTGNPYISVDEELRNAQPYREKFLRMINGFTAKELEETYITRKELGQHRRLGDYLLRIAYHESVHTGQLLDYLRTVKVPRPKIWD
jgi:uncharacterized damage-inducible protein DinB